MIAECSDCGETKTIHARKRCGRCYDREYPAQIIDGKRRRMPVEHNPGDPWDRESLLHEVEFFLTWGGLGPNDLAGRLLMTQDALLRALRRARDAGDPRALEFWRRVDNPEQVAA